jgi:hypothetical protein
MAEYKRKWDESLKIGRGAPSLLPAEAAVVPLPAGALGRQP